MSSLWDTLEHQCEDFQLHIGFRAVELHTKDVELGIVSVACVGSGSGVYSERVKPMF